MSDPLNKDFDPIADVMGEPQKRAKPKPKQAEVGDDFDPIADVMGEPQKPVVEEKKPVRETLLIDQAGKRAPAKDPLGGEQLAPMWDVSRTPEFKSELTGKHKKVEALRKKVKGRLAGEQAFFKMFPWARGSRPQTKEEKELERLEEELLPVQVSDIWKYRQHLAAERHVGETKREREERKEVRGLLDQFLEKKGIATAFHPPSLATHPRELSLYKEAAPGEDVPMLDEKGNIVIGPKPEPEYDPLQVTIDQLEERLELRPLRQRMWLAEDRRRARNAYLESLGHTRQSEKDKKLEELEAAERGLTPAELEASPEYEGARQVVSDSLVGRLAGGTLGTLSSIPMMLLSEVITGAMPSPGQAASEQLDEWGFQNLAMFVRGTTDPYGAGTYGPIHALMGNITRTWKQAALESQGLTEQDARRMGVSSGTPLAAKLTRVLENVNQWEPVSEGEYTAGGSYLGDVAQNSFRNMWHLASGLAWHMPYGLYRAGKWATTPQTPEEFAGTLTGVPLYVGKYAAHRTDEVFGGLVGSETSDFFGAFRKDPIFTALDVALPFQALRAGALSRASAAEEFAERAYMVKETKRLRERVRDMTERQRTKLQDRIKEADDLLSTAGKNTTPADKLRAKLYELGEKLNELDRRLDQAAAPTAAEIAFISKRSPLKTIKKTVEDKRSKEFISQAKVHRDRADAYFRSAFTFENIARNPSMLDEAVAFAREHKLEGIDEFAALEATRMRVSATLEQLHVTKRQLEAKIRGPFADQIRGLRDEYKSVQEYIKPITEQAVARVRSMLQEGGLMDPRTFATTQAQELWITRQINIEMRRIAGPEILRNVHGRLRSVQSEINELTNRNRYWKRTPEGRQVNSQLKAAKREINKAKNDLAAVRSETKVATAKLMKRGKESADRASRLEKDVIYIERAILNPRVANTSAAQMAAGRVGKALDGYEDVVRSMSKAETYHKAAQLLDGTTRWLNPLWGPWEISKSLARKYLEGGEEAMHWLTVAPKGAKAKLRQGQAPGDSGSGFWAADAKYRDKSWWRSFFFAPDEVVPKLVQDAMQKMHYAQNKAFYGMQEALQTLHKNAKASGDMDLLPEFRELLHLEFQNKLKRFKFHDDFRETGGTAFTLKEGVEQTAENIRLLNFANKNAKSIIDELHEVTELGKAAGVLGGDNLRKIWVRNSWSGKPLFISEEQFNAARLAGSISDEQAKLWVKMKQPAVDGGKVKNKYGGEVPAEQTVYVLHADDAARMSPVDLPELATRLERKVVGGMVLENTMRRLNWGIELREKMGLRSDLVEELLIGSQDAVRFFSNRIMANELANAASVSSHSYRKGWYRWKPELASSGDKAAAAAKNSANMWGDLAGKYVHPDVYWYLKHLEDYQAWGRLGNQRFLRGLKKTHTIFSPATTSTNFFGSHFILAPMAGFFPWLPSNMHKISKTLEMFITGKVPQGLTYKSQGKVVTKRVGGKDVPVNPLEELRLNGVQGSRTHVGRTDAMTAESMYATLYMGALGRSKNVMIAISELMQAFRGGPEGVREYAKLLKMEGLRNYGRKAVWDVAKHNLVKVGDAFHDLFAAMYASADDVNRFATGWLNLEKGMPLHKAVEVSRQAFGQYENLNHLFQVVRRSWWGEAFVSFDGTMIKEMVKRGQMLPLHASLIGRLGEEMGRQNLQDAGIDLDMLRAMSQKLPWYYRGPMRALGEIHPDLAVTDDGKINFGDMVKYLPGTYRIPMAGENGFEWMGRAFLGKSFALSLLHSFQGFDMFFKRGIESDEALDRVRQVLLPFGYPIARIGAALEGTARIGRDAPEHWTRAAIASLLGYRTTALSSGEADRLYGHKRQATERGLKRMMKSLKKQLDNQWISQEKHDLRKENLEKEIKDHKERLRQLRSHGFDKSLEQMEREKAEQDSILPVRQEYLDRLNPIQGQYD